jgi:hypothetical protein
MAQTSCARALQQQAALSRRDIPKIARRFNAGIISPCPFGTQPPQSAAGRECTEANKDNEDQEFVILRSLRFLCKNIFCHACFWHLSVPSVTHLRRQTVIHPSSARTAPDPLPCRDSWATDPRFCAFSWLPLLIFSAIQPRTFTCFHFGPPFGQVQTFVSRVPLAEVAQPLPRFQTLVTRYNTLHGADHT